MSYFYKLILFSLFSIILFSCADKSKEITTLNNQDITSVDSAEANQYPEIPSHISSYVVEDPREIVFLSDSLASNAETIALKGDYGKAHKLFNIAIDLIKTVSEEDNIDTLFNIDRVYNRIAEFYVDLLPPSYLDSVPPELTSFVTRYQLNDMLNNMEDDTSSQNLIPFSCTKSSSYNIPITYNIRVQKALTALLSSRKTKWIEKLINRANKYRPFMNEMFEKEGLPTDLTFLPLLESAFNPKAYSPAHASGLWQFIPSTGRVFDMRENYWVDERRDPIKSTQGAIRYFKKLYNQFDDWYLALASYNCGEGRVARELKKSDEQTYWVLNLPKETMNYVPLFVAYQIIAKNPHCFGLNVDSTIKGYEFDTVQVSDCIDLNKIAKGINISYDSLKSMNPHIKQWCTPPNMKNVTLYIPKDSKEDYYTFYKTLSNRDKVNWYRYQIQVGDALGSIAQRFDVSLSALKSINKMKSNRIIAGRYIFVPIPANSKIPPNSTSTSNYKGSNYKGKRIIHKIKNGESLYTISKKYGVTVKQIIEWNKIKNPSKISVGQKLYIYTNGARVYGDKRYYTVKSGESLYTISRKLGVPMNDLARWNKLSTKKPIIHPGEKLIFYGDPINNSKAQTKATTTPKGDKRYYTVKSGESLYTISKKLGVTVSDLARWNNLNSKKPIIHPGDRLTFYGTLTKENPPKASVTSKGTKKYYTVKKGETLYSISKKLGIALNDIIKWNNMDKSKPTIHPGDKIIFYGNSIKSSSKEKSPKRMSSSSQSTIKYKVKKGDTVFGIAKLFNVTTKEIISLNKLTNGKVIHPGDIILVPNDSKNSNEKIIKYKVSNGDNLWVISSKFNVPISRICNASKITRDTPLQPGDIILIPIKE